MRKMVLILLLAFLFLCPCATAEGGSLYVSDGEHAYQVQSGALWRLTSEFAPSDQVLAFDGVVEALCWRGESLYAALRTEAGVRFARWDSEAWETMFTLETDRAVHEFAVIDDRIFVLWAYSEREQRPDSSFFAGPVCIYQSDGSALAEDAYIATAIAQAEDGVWLSEQVHDMQDRVLKLCPPREAEAVLEANGISALCQTPIGLAYAGIDGLYICNEAFDVTRKIGDMDGFEDAALLCAEASILAYHRSASDALQAFPLEATSSEAATLTLINCDALADSRMMRAIEMLKEAHPGVEVQFQEMDLMKLNVSLLANEDNIDILLVDAFDITNYVSNHVIEDLGDYPEILAQFDQWIPCTDAITYDGVLYGVPWNIWANALHMNESLRPYLPSSLNPEQMSWRELMAAGAQFDGDIDGDGVQEIGLWRDSLRLPAWLFQSIASFDKLEDVTFDTDEFRDMLTLYRQCVQAGAVIDEFSDAATPSIFTLDCLYGVSTDSVYPLPELDCGPVITGDVKVFSVNSMSRNRELALELLTCYASVEAQATYGYGDSYERHYSFSPLQESSVHPIYAELTESERATVEANKAYLSRSVFTWMYAEFNRYAGDQIELLLADQLSPDELIHNIDEKFRMILLG